MLGYKNYCDRGEARKFYQKLKSKVFETGIPICKDRDGNLVTDTQSVLQIWGEHFRSLFVPEGNIADEIIPIVNYGVDCDDWNLSELCTVLKKGDPSVCTNYKGINLLAIAYKVPSVCYVQD